MKLERKSILSLIREIEDKLTPEEREKYVLTAEKIESLLHEAKIKIKKIQAADGRRSRAMIWYR